MTNPFKNHTINNQVKVIIMTGQYFRAGNRIMTSFDESPAGMYELCDTFYDSAYQMFNNFGKSAGVAVYGDNGYFNAIMGKEITAGMFSGQTTFASLGSRPYNHEGVRIAYEQPDYGCDAAGNFVGIGAGCVQDGVIPDSVMLPVDEIRQPYKEVPYSWDYGLGLMALENKDDVSSYKDYASKMAASYADLIDRTILRPLSLKQPTMVNGNQNTETSLQGIARCIASFNEVDKEENGVQITADMVSPYGGTKSDLYDYRSAGETNFDGNVINAAGNTYSLDYLDALWRDCANGWDDYAAPNHKMFLMNQIMSVKTSAMMRAQQRMIDSVFVQRDFSGVHTIPGRPGGLLLNAWNNIPIITDPNIAFDYTRKRPTNKKPGDVFLLDLKHIWMSTLTPVEVWNVNNPAITRKLHEVNVMHCRMETRIDKFIGHGRIIGLADVENVI